MFKALLKTLNISEDIAVGSLAKPMLVNLHRPNLGHLSGLLTWVFSISFQFLPNLMFSRSGLYFSLYCGKIHKEKSSNLAKMEKTQLGSLRR